MSYLLGWARRRPLITGAAGASSILAIAHRNDTESAAPRFLRTFYHVALVGIDYKLGPAAKMPHDSEERSAAMAATHQRAADRLLHVCMLHGGLYVKFGQYVASLNNVLPPQFPATLAACQDRAPTCSFDAVRRVVENELGCCLEQSFGSFDPVPVAAASLAQVHRATTLDGEPVACKVQYPQLRRQVESDLSTMWLLARLVGLTFAGHEYGWLVPEFEHTLRAELDFRREAANAARTAAHFAREPRVHVPSTLPALSGERVLTMEWIDGARLDDSSGLAARGIEPSELAPLTNAVFSRMIFEHGFVHCDPHLGNLLARRHPQSHTRRGLWRWLRPTPPSDAQLVLLDHGTYRELDCSFRRHYSELWVALLTRRHAEGRAAAAALGVPAEHYDTLALVLTFRPSASTRSLGDRLSKQERAALRAKYGHVGMADVSAFLERLPRDLLFVMRTWSLVRSLNRALGGTTRQRLLIIAEHAAAAVYAPALSVETDWRHRTRVRISARWARLRMAVLVRWIEQLGRFWATLAPLRAQLRAATTRLIHPSVRAQSASMATSEALVDTLESRVAPGSLG